MAQTRVSIRATPVICAGLIAAVTFAAFEMLTGAAQAGIDGLWMPLRMISAMVFGPRALQSSFPIATAASVGVLLHIVLSITFAFVFVSIAPPQAIATWTHGLTASATAFGVGLWIVNFYVLAPTLGWYWFPDQSNPWVQCLAHTFFYGSVLGASLSTRAVTTGELTT